MSVSDNCAHNWICRHRWRWGTYRCLVTTFRTGFNRGQRENHRQGRRHHGPESPNGSIGLTGLSSRVQSSHVEPGRDLGPVGDSTTAGGLLAIDARRFDDLDRVFTPDAYIDWYIGKRHLSTTRLHLGNVHATPNTPESPILTSVDSADCIFRQSGGNENDVRSGRAVGVDEIRADRHALINTSRGPRGLPMSTGPTMRGR